MKSFSYLKTLVVACLLATAFPSGTRAQRVISLDIATVRNVRHRLNGLNLSAFYHFNEKIVGGIEMNRFFPVKHETEGKSIGESAWDFDLNFHYLIPLGRQVRLYPLCGISHTSEREDDYAAGERAYERFWSFNTGAGILVSMGRWSPHAEYMFTWGQLNQQFVLVGISYEIEWGHSEKK